MTWERAVYVDADYDTFELCTWSQVCYTVLGHSRMGDTINAGCDPHLLLAAEILRWPYETCAHIIKDPTSPYYYQLKAMRQTAKHCNFGFMGGLGVNAFIDLVFKMSNERLDPIWAQHLRNLWFQTWPEAREYFHWIKSLHGHCVQLFVDRVRSGATFCQSANTMFQGLAADITNLAGWLITGACYTGELLIPRGHFHTSQTSRGARNRERSERMYHYALQNAHIMLGSRPVNYIHDEFLLECPESLGHEVAEELVRLMLLAAEPFTPDVKIGASPCLMRYFSKEAKPIYKEGRLTPWPE